MPRVADDSGFARHKYDGVDVVFREWRFVSEDYETDRQYVVVTEPCWIEAVHKTLELAYAEACLRLDREDPDSIAELDRYDRKRQSKERPVLVMVEVLPSDCRIGPLPRYRSWSRSELDDR